MSSSVTSRSVAFSRIDVSDELTTSIIRVTRIGDIETKLALTMNRRTQHPSQSTTMKTQILQNFIIICKLNACSQYLVLIEKSNGDKALI
jgi:hypothetical protein